MAELNINLRVSWELVRWGLAGLLLATQAGELASEDFTMTTYYPAPSGVYKKLITTADTVLARNSGNVGIGISNPTDKLVVQGNMTVTGSVKIADGTQGANRILVSDANGLASWQTPATGGFGGMFIVKQINGLCQSPNPHTGTCACPPGYNDQSTYMFQGTINSWQWSAGYTCNVPCEGDSGWIYLHICWN